MLHWKQVEENKVVRQKLFDKKHFFFVFWHSSSFPLVFYNVLPLPLVVFHGHLISPYNNNSWHHVILVTCARFLMLWRRAVDRHATSHRRMLPLIDSPNTLSNSHSVCVFTWSSHTWTKMNNNLACQSRMDRQDSDSVEHFSNCFSLTFWDTERGDRQITYMLLDKDWQLNDALLKPSVPNHSWQGCTWTYTGY